MPDNTEYTPASHADFLLAMGIMDDFLSPRQAAVVRELAEGEEGQFFFDKMVGLSNTIKAMRAVGSQDDLGYQAIASLHYFRGNYDAYITEIGPDNKNSAAFGFATFGYGGELGGISIPELQENDIELDFHYTPQTIAEIQEADGNRPGNN